MPTVIAIDGAAGAGKSTLARALAAELGLPYVNTGLMYRAVAFKAHLAGVEPDDGEALADIARATRFELDPNVRPPERPLLSSRRIVLTALRVNRTKINGSDLPTMKAQD